MTSTVAGQGYVGRIREDGLFPMRMGQVTTVQASYLLKNALTYIDSIAFSVN